MKQHFFGKGNDGGLDEQNEAIGLYEQNEAIGIDEHEAIGLDKNGKEIYWSDPDEKKVDQEKEFQAEQDMLGRQIRLILESFQASRRLHYIEVEASA